MTNEQQPEALRLAGILGDHYFYSDTNEAAAELRRLYAENEDFRATIDHLIRENAEQIGEIVALKEQRDELLEALLPFATIGSGFDMDDVLKARATIGKAGGAA